MYVHTPKPTVILPHPRSYLEYWYRAEVLSYAAYDPFAEYEQPTGTVYKLEIHSYPVIKRTPKGVWLETGFDGRTFILGNAAKQFAVPTPELALKDLKIRTDRLVHFSKLRLDAALYKQKLAENTLDQHLQEVEEALRTLKKENK